MRKRLFAIYIILVISGICLYSAGASSQAAPPPGQQAAASDTTPRTPSRFPVAKTSIETFDDLHRLPPADLKTPENVRTEVEYDAKTNCYVIRTKVGDMEVSTPFMLTADEYSDYSLKKSMQEYYRAKNAENFAKGGTEFDFLDMQFNIQALDKVFGPGGVRLKTSGSMSLTLSLVTNKIDNPALAESARKKTYFDFDEKIQANINASVGTKIGFNMTYNTDATFDFDAQKMSLKYEGDEDQIIKTIEGGNISMTTGSSLIRGGTSLFGLKTTLQFGKLTVTGLVSQQETDSKTVSSEGGSQTTEFEIGVDAYDQNRHFFLAHYFRDNYDNFISRLPYITSGITINRIEIWVTNKQGSYDNARNIVAFADLGETQADNLASNHWSTTGAQYPSNTANSLYNDIIASYPDARYISQVTQALSPLEAFGIYGGEDYAKIESARLLSSSEYTLNSQLGYVSLNSQLSSDEVLAVAFEYTKNGQTYQVGEFSTDITDSEQSLYVKMLKGSTVTNKKPIWDLMMKNVYSLGAYQIEQENFRLNIYYQNDSAGTNTAYLPVGNIKEKTLLQVMNLDRLDNNQETNYDGIFDYVSGYTVLPSSGRIIFPVVEPFGSHLQAAIGTPDASRYAYQELYDSTLTVAKQFADKNKFILKGEYQASYSSEIHLNAFNIPRGSVRVTAGGVTLTENVDYTVDYNMGVVTILNQSYIDSGTSIDVSFENQSLSMQRKTLVGLDLNYAFTPDFNLGLTLMHMKEKALTEKVNLGSEVLNNTLWGINTSYNTEFQWLTSWLNKIPTVTATAPSRLSLTAEFAQLIPGEKKNASTLSYLDDFEGSQTTIDIRTPYSWTLSATPSMFMESSLSNDLNYGRNRALLAWYYIDRIFTQRNSSATPAHIKNDLEQLSNHYVREVEYTEVFPNKELNYGESSVMQVLNLSYYPQEHGPYNTDAQNIDEEGRLLNPEKRWAGIMRKMDITDFDNSNIEYLQFWLMDPFLYNEDGSNKGGMLYFNFGEVSEDILKDGMKSYENGLPINNDTSYLSTTVWGRVSRQQSLTYAFDNSSGARVRQDVGLDGLSDDDEASFSSYQEFVAGLRAKLSGTALNRMLADPHSPLNDPARDNYQYFLSERFNEEETDILTRYKYYNGTEGNSLSADEVDDRYYQSSRSVPDVEDINQDNTLDEYERYYQYAVKITPEALQVGSNYITDVRTVTVPLRNGESSTVRWYQFKIPLRDDSEDTSHEPRQTIGSIQDFSSIRFARIFLTGFNKETHLRFATLELVRGEWRTYEYKLHSDISGSSNAPAEGDIDVSVVNIEENAGQTPVNYVLPPGVTRIISPDQSQITQLNEQAISLTIRDLPSKNARAIYKSAGTDMRNYKSLQMFTHAEQLIDDDTDLKSGELSVFIRLGSDYCNNYYEYEIPLQLTPAGRYNTYSSADQEKVWPEANMFDFPLELLTSLKQERNLAQNTNGSGVSSTTPYSSYDPDKPTNKITVMGNPSLSNVKTILVGVRNNSGRKKSATVWINELRLKGFNEEGGWAAKGNLNLAVSDIATLNMSGLVETTGFGGIDQSLSERRLDDLYQYNFAAMVDLGRFFPEKAKIKAPIFYSYTMEKSLPKYNPLDQDILLSDALEAAANDAARDSIKQLSITQSTVKSFSLSGFKVDIKSKNPMPYDPGNFTFSYAQNKQHENDPTTAYENTNTYNGNLIYSYSPLIKPWQPFGKIKSKSKSLNVLKKMSINYLPNNLSFGTSISRYYYEQQLRSIDESDVTLPVSVSKSFLWDRQFAIQWNLLQSLSMNLSTATNARIEEPSGAVNKRLFADEYTVWKDSVKNSLRHFGTPWEYQQSFNATLNVPLNNIPSLNWISLTSSYNATYNWDRGATIDDTTSVGNSISNQGRLSVNGRFNFESLYNKSKFLKSVNQKFNNRGNNSRTPQKRNRYQRTVTLRADTSTLVRHNLDSKKPVVSATLKGEAYPIKYKVVDANTIRIETRADERVIVTVLPGKRREENKWYQAGLYATRFAMMLRSVNVQFSNTRAMTLPSFEPSIGDIFGQSSAYGAMAPGLGFAFATVGTGYIDQAVDNNWLMTQDSSLISPAIYNRTNDLQTDIVLEPLKGFKITLNIARSQSHNDQIYFMYDNKPTIQGGNFTMTHMAISTSMKRLSPDNGYQSDAFDRFLQNRQIVADRLESLYAKTFYPAADFLGESNLAGQPYNRINGGINTSSADVMIPAFIAAYTGQDANEIELTAFPSWSQLIPNWKVSYDGLSQLKRMQKHFKSFIISHAYKCTYNVTSFSSYLNWAGVGGDMGFVKDSQTGLPTPSSPYDISSVTIVESFSPLLGIDFTLKNNLSGSLAYKNSRNLNLSISSVQLVEAITQDVTVGVGYKITGLRGFFSGKGGKQGTYSNDLNLRGDFSFAKTHSLIRRIEQNYTQATAGNKSINMKYSAEYKLSRYITLQAYYDLQISTPLISSSSYPTLNSDIGITIKLDLAR